MQWKHVVAGVVMAGVVLGMTLSGRAADTKSGPPSVQRSRAMTLSGTVEAIDLDKRLVTLKGPDGKMTTVEVSNRIKNLSQLKVGDQVTAKYNEGIALRVVPPGQAGSSAGVKESVSTPPLVDKPTTVHRRESTVTVTIEAIDQRAGTVTFKGPEGYSHTTKARDPKNLQLIKVGDQVEITYTEALAVSVQKQPAGAGPVRTQ